MFAFGVVAGMLSGSFGWLHSGRCVLIGTDLQRLTTTRFLDFLLDLHFSHRNQMIVVVNIVAFRACRVEKK